MTLYSLAGVLNSCDTPNWLNDDAIRLTVRQSSSVSLDILRELYDEEVYTEDISEAALQSSLAKNESGNLTTGISFTLKLPRNVNKNVVARNLADLISLNSATWRAPKAYFLIEEEASKQPFCFTGPESIKTASETVKNYHRAIKLWGLVEAKAEHNTLATRSLLFFGAQRLELKPGFGLDDLISEIKVDEVEQFQSSEISPKTLELLRSKLGDSTGAIDLDEVKQFLDKQSQDIRAQMFRSVLWEILRDQPPEKAFACLLRSTGKFVQRLNEAWKIYISTFSPQKLNEQALAKHLELTEKLEKIIGGMEVKGLTIPAAILLAVKEVQFGAHWTTLNTMILVASVVYVLAMIVAYFGQRSTLNLLTTTIDETKRDLRTQGLDENNKVLKDSFGNLESRTSIIGYVSMALVIFSSIPLIAVIYAVFWAAPPPPKPTEPAANNATASPAALR